MKGEGIVGDRREFEKRKFTRQEELGLRLMRMMRRSEEREKELSTWELANINSRVKEVIRKVEEEVSLINNHDIILHMENTNFYLGKDMQDDASVEQSGENVKFGCTEVVDKADKVDMVNFEVEQSSDMVDLVAGIEEEEGNETSLHLTAMAGTAGFLLF